MLWEEVEGVGRWSETDLRVVWVMLWEEEGGLSDGG